MQQIQLTIEKTSQDTILKFVASTMLTEGSHEYHNVEEAKDSTLVQQLFHLPFVKKVFVTSNFMAIERYAIVEWSDVQEELRVVIENYLNKHQSLFSQTAETPKVVEVYAESTPNPAAMKFVTNRLLSSQNIEIQKQDDTNEVPIAKALFEFNYIQQVFISDNYISLTKNKEVEWFEITTALRDFIKSYLLENKAIITENYLPVAKESTPEVALDLGNLDDISKEIVQILDEYIKPAVTSDGGNIMFQSYDTESQTVNVVLQGACSGCPSSTVTLKNGIEATLKQLLPNKVNEVVAING